MQQGSSPTAYTVAANLVSALGFAWFFWLALTEPARFLDLVAKDGIEETGLVEWLTVIVLLPGIAAALFALARWRRRLPHPLLGPWILLWSLACIYFAGEEASWGQWLFHWQTPEALLELNDQGETNLHNISSWFDQKPRLLVELFIVIAGLLIPVAHRLRTGSGYAPGDWRHWVYAPASCWAAAAALLITWVVNKLEPLFGFLVFVNAEFRELTVAWFLTLYLLSYALRLGSAPPAEA
jgi:hypothetical protein